ncbi:MAG: 30S ribosomal protein S16 [Patescibacteria group bacterium]
MIRLARRGKKNAPFFRLLVSEKSRDLYGTALEEVGTYNPAAKDKPVTLKADRITYWLSKGAQASPSVHNLLVKEKVITEKKIVKSKAKKKAEKK